MGRAYAAGDATRRVRGLLRGDPGRGPAGQARRDLRSHARNRWRGRPRRPTRTGEAPPRFDPRRAPPNRRRGGAPAQRRATREDHASGVGPPRDGIGREGRLVNDLAYDRGMRIRREVLGDEHVDAAVERTTAFTADFQDLITRYAWGEIWARPGLDRKTRSCITLTALVALGRLEELEMHVRAALRVGLTREEIKEVLLQAAIYCGVPAANGAFAVFQRVLDEDGRSQGSQPS